jgi:short-subunit dehydrogenase
MKTVLITGASSGIGKSFARRFALRGWRVLAVAQHEEGLEALKKELEEEFQAEVQTFAMDLTEADAPERLYQACENMRVDVLVNNAGFGDSGAFLESDLKKQEAMVKVNVLALMKLTHLFGHDMKNRNSGGILNVASIAAFVPGPYMSVYYATKAFVLSFSQALAEEMRDSDVKVTCLCPGPVDTDFFRKADLLESPMWKIAPPAKACMVVHKAVVGLFLGKDMVINSVSGRLFYLISRITPRRLMLKLTGIVNGKR